VLIVSDSSSLNYLAHFDFKTTTLSVIVPGTNNFLSGIQALQKPQSIYAGNGGFDVISMADGWNHQPLTTARNHLRQTNSGSVECVKETQMPG
jgi:hypothetical protein